MSLVLRRIKWPPDGRPSDKPDFEVFDGEKAIGRIYEKIVPGGVAWFWSIYGLAIRGEKVPGGLAVSLDDAMAEFKDAWQMADKR